MTVDYEADDFVQPPHADPEFARIHAALCAVLTKFEADPEFKHAMPILETRAALSGKTIIKGNWI